MAPVSGPRTAAPALSGEERGANRSWEPGFGENTRDGVLKHELVFFKLGGHRNGLGFISLKTAFR